MFTKATIPIMYISWAYYDLNDIPEDEAKTLVGIYELKSSHKLNVKKILDRGAVLKSRLRLEKPLCKYGYTRKQVERIMGKRLGQFDKWMRGQTMAICEVKPGWPGCKKAHGLITYQIDVECFLAGLDPLD